jgi:hypothetical protein
MAKENQLSYYSAKLLKDALVELGYTEVKNIKNKKELIQYVTLLIQTEGPDTYISDSDEDSDDDTIITIDMSHVLDIITNI